MTLPAPLAIVALSCLVIVLVEVLTLLFVSNTSSYKRIVSDIERAAKELERLSAAGAAATTSAQKKRERSLEMQLTYLTRDFYFHRMKQYLIMTTLLASMFYVLRTWYMGKPVATLPFTPMFPFSKVIHQWLEKPAATDCSFLFLFVLCNLGVRPNVSKLIGTQLPPSVTKATDMQNLTSRFTRLTTKKFS